MPGTGFFDLPFEIRQLVLKIYFESSCQIPYAWRGELGSRSYDKQDLDFRDCSPILRSCKSLYEEGLKLYYKNVCFYLPLYHYPPPHNNTLKLKDVVKLNMRKCIGFPFETSKMRWTRIVDHFPTLEMLVFNTGYETFPAMEATFSRESNQHELTIEDVEAVASGSAQKINKEEELQHIQTLLAKRPNLSIGAVVHIISPKRHEAYNHGILLIDLARGTLIKVISIHSSCMYADKHRSRSQDAAQSRPCTPWDCKWITHRDNIVDLTAESEATNKLGEVRIATLVDRLSFDVFTFREKAYADPLYDEKVRVWRVAAPAGRLLPYSADVLKFMDQYRLGKWDE